MTVQPIMVGVRTIVDLQERNHCDLTGRNDTCCHPSSAIEKTIRNVTSDITLTVLDTTIIADATTNDMVITLPSAIDKKGHYYIIKKVDTSVHTITIRPDPTLPNEKIDNESKYVITYRYDSITVISDGTKWWMT